MQADPPTLEYARKPPAARFSWARAWWCAGAGGLAGAVGIVALGTISLVLIGVSAAIALVAGLLVGRRTRSLLQIAIYSLVIGLASCLPALAVLVAMTEATDPMAGLTL